MKLIRLTSVCWIVLAALHCGCQPQRPPQRPDFDRQYPGPPLPFQPSRMDQLSRMGEELMSRIQSLGRSSYFDKLKSYYSGGGSGDYGDEGCCGKLDFVSFNFFKEN